MLILHETAVQFQQDESDLRKWPPN